MNTIVRFQIFNSKKREIGFSIFEVGLFSSFYSLIFIVFNCTNLMAQQDPHFTRYSFITDMMYNPAAVARAQQSKLIVFYRDQWAGLKGAPKTPGLSFETPLSDNAGLGFNCFQDKIGFDTHFAFQANYAYRLSINKKYNLSIGLKGGTSIINSNFSDLITPEPDKTDPVYTDGKRSIVPRVGMGLLFHSDATYVGLGIPALAAFVPNDGVFIADDGVFLSRHFYMTAGHVFDVPRSDFQFKPGILIKYHPAAPLQIDILSQIWYKDILALGISYRTGDAIAAMIDIAISKNMVFSYAYDMTYSDFTNVGRNAHEIVFSIGLSKNDKVVPSMHKFPTLQRF